MPIPATLDAEQASFLSVSIGQCCPDLTLVAPELIASDAAFSSALQASVFGKPANPQGQDEGEARVAYIRSQSWWRIGGIGVKIFDSKENLRFSYFKRP